MSKIYAVMALKKSITVEVLGMNRELDLTFAEGMLGCMPIFETEESAKEYAGEDFEVIELKA